MIGGHSNRSVDEYLQCLLRVYSKKVGLVVWMYVCYTMFQLFTALHYVTKIAICVGILRFRKNSLKLFYHIDET